MLKIIYWCLTLNSPRVTFYLVRARKRHAEIEEKAQAGILLRKPKEWQAPYMDDCLAVRLGEFFMLYFVEEGIWQGGIAVAQRFFFPS